MKVLVIDNEPRWCDFCQSLGYTIIKNISPEELEKSDFDIYIISDRQRLELFTTLKDLGKRFVIATGQPITRKAIEAYRLGAIDYMSKDFRPEVIKEKVKECHRLN